MSENNLSTDLIIFDCDGVLVDSELISNTVMSEMLTSMGSPTSYEECITLFLGHSWDDCLKTIEQRAQKKMPDEFYDMYIKKVFFRFEKELQPIKGITKALDNISHRFCVASSGPHEKINRTLTITGLIRKFKGKIYSAEDVNRGKPYPDLFLYAAKKMDSLASKTIVVEDSIPGIKAGLAAGMKVLAYNPQNSDQLNNLDTEGVFVFKSMQQLPSLINSI